MEAKNLQIGDWILLSETPVQVHSIREIGGLYYIVAERWKLTASNYASTYKPIPLTENILKANGFEQNVLLKEGFYYAPKFDMNDVVFKVAVDDYEDVWHVESIVDHNDNAYALFNVCYVHEMQHILRFCGLDELAENFKVV